MSSNQEFTEEELNQIEEISKQYDEMVQDELEQNPIEMGNCGFICDGKCYDCIGSGTYDTADEV